MQFLHLFSPHCLYRYHFVWNSLLLPTLRPLVCDSRIIPPTRLSDLMQSLLPHIPSVMNFPKRKKMLFPHTLISKLAFISKFTWSVEVFWEWWIDTFLIFSTGVDCLGISGGDYPKKCSKNYLGGDLVNWITFQDVIVNKLKEYCNIVRALISNGVLTCFWLLCPPFCQYLYS